MELPDDYEEKLQEAKEKGGDQYAHLDFPDIKEFRPRKRLGEEVVEQEVYGIDPFTYNLLLNTMPADTVIFTEKQKQLFIEEVRFIISVGYQINYSIVSVALSQREF